MDTAKRLEPDHAAPASARGPRGDPRVFQELRELVSKGPSEFGISGTLESWDRSADLSRITVPTLVIGAEHDTMDPRYMEWMARQLPEGEYLYCPEGSHMAMWDDPETYHRGLERFIRQVGS